MHITFVTPGLTCARPAENTSIVFVFVVEYVLVGMCIACSCNCAWMSCCVVETICVITHCTNGSSRPKCLGFVALTGPEVSRNAFPTFPVLRKRRCTWCCLAVHKNRNYSCLDWYKLVINTLLYAYLRSKICFLA